MTTKTVAELEREIQVLRETIRRQSAMAFDAESRFRTIFEQTPFSIQIFSADGKTLYVNNAWKKIFSLHEEFIESFIMKEYNVLTDPILEKQGVLPYIHRAFNGDVVEVPEIFYDPSEVGISAPGAWLKALMYPLKDPSGKVKEVVIIHTDVTDERYAEIEKEEVLAELSQERNRLDAILRQMPAGILVSDAKTGKFSLYNKQLEVLLGRIQGATDFREYRTSRGFFSDGKEYAPDEWPMSRSLRDGEVVTNEEIRLLSAQGENSFVQVSSGPIRELDGEITAAIMIMTDVTARKRIESDQNFLAGLSSILQSSLDYTEIIHQISASLIPYLADGVIVDVIEDFEIKRIHTRHLDPVKEELMRELQKKFPPEIGSPQPTSRVIRSGLPELLSHVNVTDIREHTVNGDHFDLMKRIGVRSHIAVPLYIRGEIIGALNFHITSDRRPFDEQDLVLSVEIARRASIAIENARLYRNARSAVRLRDDFISIASHELKTPITSLKLQSQVLGIAISKIDLSPQDSTFLTNTAGILNRQLDKLTRLVEDMLDISRIESGKLTIVKKPVNLTELIQEVVKRFDDQLKLLSIPIELSLQPQLNINCDPYRIEQVITNLMTNAIRYGNRKPIHIDLAETDSVAVFRIRDHGIGIAEEDQERIFLRFERANIGHEGGLGLGLYISRQIIDEHKGRIYLHSTPDVGTTFIVEIPKI